MSFLTLNVLHKKNDINIKKVTKGLKCLCSDE